MVGKELQQSEDAAEVVAVVEAAVNNLSQFLSNMHHEWLLKMNASVSQQLDMPLMKQVGFRSCFWRSQRALHFGNQRLAQCAVQDKNAGGVIAANTGRQAFEAFQEVRLWTSLGHSIPNIAKQLQADAERLQLLKCNVTTLVAQHNQVRSFVDVVRGPRKTQTPSENVARWC